MSFQMLALVEDIIFGSQSRKGVALQLASCANADGTRIYPAVETIAVKVECSKRTVQRSLKEFQSCGILHLVKLGGHGPRNANEYAYDVPILKALSCGHSEIFIYKNDQKKRCMGVRIVENKGDTVSPIAANKGDTVSSKGDTVSNKGDTLSPNPSKNLLRTEEDAPAPDFEALFFKYRDAAKRYGFVQANFITLKTNRFEFEKIIADFGADDWLEALAFASTDDACTGKLKAQSGHSKAWRLSFLKMCDGKWLANKLDVWRDAYPDGPPKAKADCTSVVIKPGSKNWDAWLGHYEATNPKRAKIMKNLDYFAVPTEWPDVKAVQA